MMMCSFWKMGGVAVAVAYAGDRGVRGGCAERAPSVRRLEYKLSQQEQFLHSISVGGGACGYVEILSFALDSGPCEGRSLEPPQK